MALTIPEALKKVSNPMTAMMLRSVATTSELGAVISIQSEDGIGLQLDREGLLPDTEFVADNSGDGVSPDLTDFTTGADDVPIVQFRRIVGNMDVDGLAQAAVPGNFNRQVAKKAKTTWRKVKDGSINGGFVSSSTIVSAITSITAVVGYGPWLDSTRRGPGSIKVTVNVSGTDADYQFRAPGESSYGPAVNVTADGDITLKGFNESYYVTVTADISAATASQEEIVYFSSGTNEFDGLFNLVHPTMTVPVVGANGDSFDFALMDDLIDRVKVRENRAFIMNGKLVNKFFAEHRGLGGSDPQHMALPGYAGQVPTYRGIPVLTEDNIKSYTVGSGTVSNMALVSLDPSEGFCLAAQTTGGEAAALTPDADPRTRSVLGFRVEDLGPLEVKDARRTRVKWYGAPVLKSYLACAVKQGVVQV